MDSVVEKIPIVMPHMMHISTHRLVSIFHIATSAKNMNGIAGIIYRVLESRGLKPWDLEKQYCQWHKGNWLYKIFLSFLKPKFMKDDGVLSPEAINLERSLAAGKK